MTFRRFDTAGHVTVRVKCKAGEVQLISHDEPTTEVEVSALDAADEEVASRTRIDDDASRSDHHRVTVEVPSDGADGGFLSRVVSLTSGGAKVRVVVRCPAGADLEVTTASASIDAVGHFGAVDAKSASGDTRLEHVAGDLTVRSASGDIWVIRADAGAKIDSASGDVRCGYLEGVTTISTASGDVTVQSAESPLTVRTASGDVEAHDVFAGCAIHTASGDQRVERAVAGDTRLDTVSGDLQIGVAKGTTVHVHAESVTGDLASDIDLDGDPGDDPADGDGPALDLRARTVSGDVRIRRAPAMT
jgi:hypothetical protein